MPSPLEFKTAVARQALEDLKDAARQIWFNETDVTVLNLCQCAIVFAGAVKARQDAKGMTLERWMKEDRSKDNGSDEKR